MNIADHLKKAAAEHAVNFVKSGMVIGLGTGSTAYYATMRIGALLKDNSLNNILAVPSSKETESLARSLDIPLTDFKNNSVLDIYIDGADEVDENLNLIKGGGGAMLREKIVAQASKEFIVVVDASKISARLGEKWKVPVEVFPFAFDVEAHFLAGNSKGVYPRVDNDGALFITDEGNYIIDVDFGIIDNPASAADMLNNRAGVAAHGLFVGFASQVVSASAEGISILRKFN